MCDMFLFVFGVRAEPVVIPVLAWSNGCSSGGRYESRSEKKIDEFDAKAQEWTEDDVQKWLTKCKASTDVMAKFKSEGIDGRALLILGNDELKQLAPAIGPRLRLLSQLQELQIAQSEVETAKRSNDLNLQDLSCTIYLGALTELTLMAPMLEQRKLPRVALVVYTSGPNRNRGWGGNDNDTDKAVIPPGTPSTLLDLREVQVTSWSTGGSGGEDRLTANATLQAEFVTHSALGIRDHKGLSWAMHAKALGVDPRDPHWDPEFAPAEEHVRRCLGVSVSYDSQNKRGALVEFGAHVSWSKKTHRVYPVAFRRAVRTMLLCAKRPEENSLYKVPKDVLLLFVKYLSLCYNASPFADFPHPFPDSLKPKEEAEGDNDNN